MPVVQLSSGTALTKSLLLISITVQLIAIINPVHYPNTILIIKLTPLVIHK